MNRSMPDIFPSALSALTWPRTRLRWRIVSDDAVQDAGQITTDLAMDLDRRHHPLEVLAVHAVGQVAEADGQVAAEAQSRS